MHFVHISATETRQSFKKYQTVKYLYISTNFQNPSQTESFVSKKDSMCWVKEDIW